MRVADRETGTEEKVLDSVLYYSSPHYRGARMSKCLPISIQGKLAFVSHNDRLFWLNRVSADAASASSISENAQTASSSAGTGK